MTERNLNRITIPEEELEEQFVRASGPGGQHVNKVSSAVQLRWNVDASEIPLAVKRRFRELYNSKITSSGDIILEVSDHRSQQLNRQAARKRLDEMLQKALKPKKKRIATRPTAGSVKQRLKRRRSRARLKRAGGV